MIVGRQNKVLPQLEFKSESLILNAVCITIPMLIDSYFVAEMSGINKKKKNDKKIKSSTYLIHITCT